VPWAFGLAIMATGATCDPVDRSADPREAVVAAFARAGLLAAPDGVALLDRPSTFRTTRAVVRAWRASEPADIYVAHLSMTPAGAVVGEPSVFNLTQTPADEGVPNARGERVVFTVRAEAGVIGIRSLDLRGEEALDGSWSRKARAQNALTNLQLTGQTAGVRSTFWAIDPPSEVEVSITRDGWIEVRGDRVSRMPVEGGASIGDLHGLEFRPSTKAQPGNLTTWAVDRVRGLSWFGDDRMQMLKAVSFDVLDLFRRTQTSVMGDDTADEIAEDLGDIVTRNPPSTYTDPETGWPPPPIEPFLNKPLEGEGKWIPLENDPFVPMNPGVPAAFLTSFVRTDTQRSYTRIYVTMWDPRQVELHMVAGSVEPKGASGEAGPGIIPRTPERMKRLVAALNGGFQALHGEWGMMGDGVIYLPPKPYAATVTEMRDGTTGFGTWPSDPVVPPTILSYRQNLTPLVLDGKINPYKRGWWGGTPPEWEDRVHSTRTGICLTNEGFIAYFYGNEIDVMPLAQAMVQARCKYGLHLDMNPGHTGLEFYRVAPSGMLPDLGRPLDKKWEAEGPVPFLDGWTFRARRMVRFMGLMNFPRYIQREARDYFYLTLRDVIPGEDLKPVVQPALPDEGKWRTTGLPQHGFPYALATAHLRPDAGRPNAKVLLVKLDPRTLRVAADERDAKDPVVTFSNANTGAGDTTLWKTPRAFVISREPVVGGTPIVAGTGTGAASTNVVAALGIQDDDGMLVYVEVQDDRREGEDGALLSSLLEKLGCSSRLLLKLSLVPAFGAEPVAADEKGRTFGRVVRLVRGQAPGAARIFEDTPIVDPSEWAPLQAKRIRYFKKPKKTSEETESEPAPEP
jgi:hypothetical protein